MSIRTPLICEEWYHCYNRGVEKRKTYMLADDYDRFLALLYLCNTTKTFHLSNYRDVALHSILSDPTIDRGELLVEIGAYSLMPNHVHLVLRQMKDGGISLFMQKLFTAYTMYFNKRHYHSGPLFAGVYKSKHIKNDAYLKQVVPYVLLNAAELAEPQWKKGAGTIAIIEKKIREYPYSSLKDFFNTPRAENKLVVSMDPYYDKKPTLRAMVTLAQQYYREKSSPEF
jgi:REP element-mobilizing transposase RayT